MSEKNWKKEDQVVLGRWEIPSEIREAIVAPQICKECYNKLSQKYDMEKAFVPDDEKHVVNFIFFVDVFYLKDNNSWKRSVEYDWKRKDGSRFMVWCE